MLCEIVDSAIALKIVWGPKSWSSRSAPFDTEMTIVEPDRKSSPDQPTELFELYQLELTLNDRQGAWRGYKPHDSSPSGDALLLRETKSKEWKGLLAQ